MVDIRPVETEENILREAHATDMSNPVVAARLAPVDPISSSGQFKDDPQLPPQPIPYSRPAVVTMNKGFSYRLPMLSYILVGFYILLFVLQGATTGLEIGSYMIQKNQFSATAFGSATPLLSNAEYFNIGLLVIFILLIIFLLSGKRVLRYLALLLSLSGLSYEVYQLTNSLKMFIPNVGSTSYFGWSFIWSYSVAPLIPFVLILALTVMHLLRPVLKRAYT